MATNPWLSGKPRDTEEIIRDGQSKMLKFFEIETTLRAQVKELCQPVFDSTREQQENYTQQQRSIGEIEERIAQLEDLFHEGKTKEDRFTEVKQQYRELNGERIKDISDLHVMFKHLENLVTDSLYKQEMKLKRLEFFDERLKDVSNEYNQIHD